MSIPTSTSSLTRLAQTLDADLGGVDELPTGESASLVRVTRSGEIAVRSLDADHPYDALLGFVAPEDWEVFGVIAPGWGTYYAGPAKGDRRRCRAIHLAQRSGEEVSVLRFSDDLDGTVVDEPQSPGRVADCIRRAMGLATPAETPATLAAYWTDDVLLHLAARGHPSFNGALVERCEIDEFLADRPLSWGDVRWAVIEAGGNVVLDASLAAWMDDGMFARLMLAEMVEPDIAISAAKRACTPDAWTYLLTQFVTLAMDSLDDDG